MQLRGVGFYVPRHRRTWLCFLQLASSSRLPHNYDLRAADPLCHVPTSSTTTEPFDVFFDPLHSRQIDRTPILANMANPQKSSPGPNRPPRAPTITIDTSALGRSSENSVMQEHDDIISWLMQLPENKRLILQPRCEGDSYDIWKSRAASPHISDAAEDLTVPFEPP